MRLEELTRDQIATYAPHAVVVLPTASIEQHGPHLPVVVDSLLCTTVAQRAAACARDQCGEHAVWVTPTFSWGNSHHHRPFAGVLSLASDQYIAAVTDVVEGLMLSGFGRILILNGHGGNTAPNAVIAQDFVHRLGHRVHIAAADYWDIGRAAVVEAGLIANDRIPGHAGEFETALIQAIRPELVSTEGLRTITESQNMGQPQTSLPPVVLQSQGAWLAQGGYTDEPYSATLQQGIQMLAILVAEVAQVIMGLYRLPTLGVEGS